MPSFYKRDRAYLVTMCEEFQSFLNDDEHDILVLNLPPRHGKSLTLGKFVEWVLGNDHTKKIMTGSYNETLSTVFSKNVRNTLQEEKADENKIVYSDIFDAAIKYGDAAKTFGVCRTAIITIWQPLQQGLQQVSVLTLLSLMMLSRMLRKLTTRQY